MSTGRHQHATCPDSYPLWEEQMKMASSSTQFSGDDMELYYQIYSPKAGKSIDPRLITLLEYFRELCDQQRELFRKIFPGSDELVAFFRKIGEVVTQVKSTRREVTTLQRSMSLGSPRTREIKGGGVSPLRPERFRVRTVVVNGGGGGGGQGGSDTKSGQGGSDTQSTASK